MTAERSDGARGGESGEVTGLRACGGRRSSLPRRRGEWREQCQLGVAGCQCRGLTGRRWEGSQRLSACLELSWSRSGLLVGQQPRAPRISVARTSVRPRQSPRGDFVFFGGCLEVAQAEPPTVADLQRRGPTASLCPSPMGDSSGPAAGGVSPPVTLVVASGRSLAPNFGVRT